MFTPNSNCSLVNYSSSSDSDDNPIENKTKQSLPLPNAIKNRFKYSVLDDVPVDNIEKHEGRQRSFQHERGNWASYAYALANCDIIEEIQQLIKFHFSSKIDLKVSNEIHISLTKTIILRHHWIESFVKEVQSKLEHFSEFVIEFKNLKVYCNEEETRTFIALDVQQNYTKDLVKLVKIFDKVLEEYQLETFYRNPSFHASILWCLGNEKQSIINELNNLQKKLDDIYLTNYDSFVVKVQSIYCKIGNKLYTFNLNKR